MNPNFIAQARLAIRTGRTIVLETRMKHNILCDICFIVVFFNLRMFLTQRVPVLPLSRLRRQFWRKEIQVQKLLSFLLCKGKNYTQRCLFLLLLLLYFAAIAATAAVVVVFVALKAFQVVFFFYYWFCYCSCCCFVNVV